MVKIEKEHSPIYKNDIRLTTSNQVRVMLSRIANALIKDEITEDKARALVYLSNTLLNSIKQTDLEQRLEELEELVKKSVIS